MFPYICGMEQERKYLTKDEMKILYKYGIKLTRDRYDAYDLLSILPYRWKEGSKKNRDEHWEYINFYKDDTGWTCTTPYWQYDGACELVGWNTVHGDTLVECLFNAVLRLAINDRTSLHESKLAKTGFFADDLYHVTKEAIGRYNEQ